MNSEVHPTVIIERNTKLGKNVIISPFSHIGLSYSDVKEKYYKGVKKYQKYENKFTDIGDNTFIGPNAIVGKGATIGSNCLIEHNSYIGENTKIGNHSFLRYGCQIYDNIEIGNDCIISGFICNNVKIGNNVEFFGSCIHRYINREIGEPEPHPIIADNVFVGFKSLIIGGIHIGDGAIIKAGAIVTKDVDNYEIVNAGKRR